MGERDKPRGVYGDFRRFAHAFCPALADTLSRAAWAMHIAAVVLGVMPPRQVWPDLAPAVIGLHPITP